VVKIADGPQCWEKAMDNPVFRRVFPPPMITKSAFRLVLRDGSVRGCNYRYARLEAEFLKRYLDLDLIKAMARYTFEHWRMCALAMRADGLDLVRTNPGLAYLVASNNLFAGRCKRPWHRARGMVRWKRTKILERCGFPATSSAVKIMSRIDPATLRYPVIDELRRVFAGSDLRARKYLCFLPRVTPVVTAILSESSQLARVTGGFLEEVSTLDDNAKLIGMYYDIQRMVGEMECSKIGRFRRLADIARIHEMLVPKYNTYFLGKVKRVSLPPGPIPDIVSAQLTVEHIRDTFELAAWGIRQHNCLASYHGIAMSGDVHLYRVTVPEEASLSLVHKDGRWTLDQLYGESNGPVMAYTRHLVDAWIRDYSDAPPDLGSVLAPKGLSIAEVSGLIDRAGLDAATIGDLLGSPGTRFFRLEDPEPALVAIRQAHGQWEPVLVRADGGGDVFEQTRRWIADWLFGMIPFGTVYQPGFPLACGGR
jgi:hypothetical protein